MTDKKPDSEDLELFKKCAQGDKKAWKLFVNKYSCLIYSSIHKIFKIKNFRYTKDDVDDLFSDIFLKLFENNCKKLHQFEGKNGCSPATWISTIATRIVLDFLRTHKESDSIDNQDENENSHVVMTPWLPLEFAKVVFSGAKSSQAHLLVHDTLRNRRGKMISPSPAESPRSGTLN